MPKAWRRSPRAQQGVWAKCQCLSPGWPDANLTGDSESSVGRGHRPSRLRSLFQHCGALDTDLFQMLGFGFAGDRFSGPGARLPGDG